MTFVSRNITASFILGQGSFGTAPGVGALNAVQLPPGLRIFAHVENAGGRSMGTAEVHIFGMTFFLMNQLSTLGQIITSQRSNKIILQAGNDGSPPSTIFDGTIVSAMGDFGSEPQVAFHVFANTGLFEAVLPAPPISIRGSADVAGMLSGLATLMNKNFENNGVVVKLSNAYYAGSARDQALAIVRDAGIEWNGLDNDVLAIWPPGGSRNNVVAQLSPSSGMIRYPRFDSMGVVVDTEFNPTIAVGNVVNVSSSLTGANGNWTVRRVDHDISARAPRGPWQTTVYGTKIAGQAVA